MWMTNQKTHAKSTQQQSTTTTDQQQIESQLTETVGLDMVLERVRRCLSGRTSTHQTEILELSLRHIFISGDLLYNTLLTELTTATNQLSLSTDDGQSSETETDLQIHYCIWSLLQEIEALSDHLEPLCQLLNNATTEILEALDRSSSIYAHQYLTQEEQDADRTAILAAIEVAHIPDNTYYQWMQAVRLLTARLQSWQEANACRLAFAQHFAHIALVAPALNQIDATVDALLQTISAIFNTILPAFHTITKGDDETIAMLLLDLVQKSDQILLHLKTLTEPLCALIRQYGIESTLQ
jgi:hypothetical protein